MNMSIPGFSITGHRGAMAHELENSLSSFDLALDMGADMVELDVRRTKDGKVVVMHDPKFNRVAKTNGQVAKHTLHDLQSRQLRNGEYIPSLEDVLIFLKGRCDVNIEIKSHHIEHEVLRVVKKCGMLRSVIISAREIEILRRMRRLHSTIRLGFICYRFIEHNVELAESLGCYSIHPRNGYKLSPSVTAYAHVKEMKVFVWTINTLSGLLKSVQSGVDGVITDFPDKAKEWLKHIKKRKKGFKTVYFYDRPKKFH